MTAEAVAKALGGRKVGAAWMAHCPAHDDRTPSLSIAVAHNGNVLLRCHAGCDQRKVLAALRARSVWDERGPIRFSRKLDRVSLTGGDSDTMRRTEAALAIWRGCQSAERTL